MDLTCDDKIAAVIEVLKFYIKLRYLKSKYLFNLDLTALSKRRINFIH